MKHQQKKISMLNPFSNGKTSEKTNKQTNEFSFRIEYIFRLVDIILEKMSDAPEDPSGSNNANYGNPSGYNKGATRLTVNEQQSKMGNQCQC